MNVLSSRLLGLAIIWHFLQQYQFMIRIVVCKPLTQFPKRRMPELVQDRCGVRDDTKDADVDTTSKDRSTYPVTRHASFLVGM